MESNYRVLMKNKNKNKPNEQWQTKSDLQDQSQSRRQGLKQLEERTHSLPRTCQSHREGQELQWTGLHQVQSAWARLRCWPFSPTVLAICSLTIICTCDSPWCSHHYHMYVGKEESLSTVGKSANWYRLYGRQRELEMHWVDRGPERQIARAVSPMGPSFKFLDRYV